VITYLGYLAASIRRRRITIIARHEKRRLRRGWLHRLVFGGAQ
jgi:hypothetical protein